MEILDCEELDKEFDRVLEESEPCEDCLSKEISCFAVPKHPITNATPEEIEKIEEQLSNLRNCNECKKC